MSISDRVSAVGWIVVDICETIVNDAGSNGATSLTVVSLSIGFVTVVVDVVFIVDVVIVVGIFVVVKLGHLLEHNPKCLTDCLPFDLLQKILQNLFEKWVLKFNFVFCRFSLIFV